MRTVWKFKVPFHHEFASKREPVSFPMGAEIVAFGMDPETGRPAVWAECYDQEERIQKRTLIACGTGHEVPPGANYRGTAFCGVYVWHVYELSA